MKKLIVLVAALLSSIAINAQNFYVEFWGSDGYSIKKKKDPADSLLYLAKGQEPQSYDLYRKGRKMDELYLSKENRRRRILLNKREGKYYIDDYEILMDSTLMREINAHGVKYPTQPAHISHVSHSSHYSSTHVSHVSHSSHYSSIFDNE